MTEASSSASRPLIVALGGGLINKSPQDPPYMWIGQETELRAAAAAKLWQQNQSALVIFSGGPQGTNTPSEASTMAGYTERAPWNVPSANILTENTSIDTASNVRNVVALLKQNMISTSAVTLIAGNTNLGRAAAYFRAYGYTVTPLLARPVLGSDIQKYNLPDPPVVITWKARLAEILLRIEQLFDPTGRLITLIKEWQLRRQRRNQS